MKANELRIGNYISLYNEFCTINGIDKKHPNDDEYYITINNSRNIGYWISQIKPIPLTEEWLLKCEQIEKKADGLFILKLLFAYDIRILEVKKGYTFWTQNTLLSGSIDYLHQLQNLYFALTQEELKIK